MKRILTLTLLILLVSVSYVSARVQYDSTGRHIIYDDTIRGMERAEAAQELQQRKMEAAAAAKLDYNEALNTLEMPKSNFAKNKAKYRFEQVVE